MDIAADAKVFEARSQARTLTLDGLLALDHAALTPLYRAARVPTIESVRGDLRGRMLAIPSLPAPFAAGPRRLASSSRFPWRGKTFTPKDALAGEGINRVVFDRVKLFRFTTFIGRSRAGDFDAVQLDYDHPGNPFFIRAIKDEIRELSPGLWLGQAWVQALGTTTLGLWFGLTSR
ncbi:MAG: hypothetical protein ACHREM_12660 [Polyangiales bacterium]